MLKDEVELLFAVHNPGNFVLNSRGILNQDFRYIHGFDSKGVGTRRRYQYYKIRKHRHTALEINPHRPYPCTHESVLSFETCLDDYYQSESNCTFQEMNGSQNCSDSNAFEKYGKLVSYIVDMGIKDLLDLTKCQMPCIFEYYELFKVSDEVLYDGPKDSILFEFVAESDDLFKSEEILIYNSNNFIADVGGFLGLLLGASAYTFFLEIKAALNAVKIWITNQSRGRNLTS